jgi:hypothetical protein
MHPTTHARDPGVARSTLRPSGPFTLADRALATILITLAAGIALLSLLGPLAFGLLRYHVVPDVENQVVGADLVALVLVAPVCVVAGLLVRRGRRAGHVLALAPTAFVMYLYTQLAIGGEFAAVPGNSERAFALLLALFWLAGAGFVLAWRSVDGNTLPELADPLRRTAGIVLLMVAGFLTVGLHLRGLVEVVDGSPDGVAYTQSPTVFWVVKWMDLGVVVPLSVLTAVGMLRRAPWAVRLTYAVIGWGALLASAVAAMGVVMVMHHDPSASLAVTCGFVGFALAFWALAGWLFRPLLREPPSGSGQQRAHPET